MSTFHLLVRLDTPANELPELEILLNELIVRIDKAYKRCQHILRSGLFASVGYKIAGTKVLVEIEYVWGKPSLEVIESVMATRPAHIVSIQQRRSIPVEFLSEEEQKQRQEIRKVEKKRREGRKHTQTIKAIQKLALYKVADSIQYCGIKKGDLILTLINKVMRKAFVWRKNSWHKTPMPALKRLEGCSPLEFTIVVGTTFAKTVEDSFGLEIEGREEEND